MNHPTFFLPPPYWKAQSRVEKQRSLYTGCFQFCGHKAGATWRSTINSSGERAQYPVRLETRVRELNASEDHEELKVQRGLYNTANWLDTSSSLTGGFSFRSGLFHARENAMSYLVLSPLASPEVLEAVNGHRDLKGLTICFARIVCEINLVDVH